jgi:asparagine synthase (glutamine-hydrolysing)
MCGLYASIGVMPDRSRVDIIAHRGPDGSGWEEHPSPCGLVALGHRRLAIIDLSDGGHQPMSSADGQFRIVFNGEIYNYVELRQRLIAKGEVFRTGSDTEVLLRAYAVWGVDCLAELRGMFAFVLLDKVEAKIFAARDRYGIKPLYFIATSGSVAFASEIKQLLGLPGASGRMNIARVHDFLAEGMSDHTAQTMFEGIDQLRGGEYAEVNLAGSEPSLTISRWYRPSLARISLSASEANERFAHLFQNSIALHLRSDVTLGSCLSGGLDSSTIVGVATRMLPAGTTMDTVSACYPGEAVDERRFMDAVVAKTGVRSHIVLPRADDVMALAEKITWHQDEPFGSTSIIAQWLVFAAARQAGVKVMLDGQGADEQLAGYHFVFQYHLAGLVRAGRIGEAVRLVRDRASRHGVSVGSQVQRLLAVLLPGVLTAPFRQRRVGWLAGDVSRSSGKTGGAMAAAAESAELARPTDLASICDLMVHASNLPMLLHWEDRNSMAHSVEARVPFLDGPLVDFSLALGNQHKMQGHETKQVLRRAMSQFLPPEVLGRQDKLGFATPEEIWFRSSLKGWLHDGVEKTLSLYPQLFDAPLLRQMRDAMAEGTLRPTSALWRVVNLGIWGERFKVML